MEIRDVTPAHYENIITLYRRCFGIRTNLEAIRRKYDGKAIGYIAMDGNRPAAYYGVFKQTLVINGVELISAAQSGDTMTDPDYRGQGLFIELAKITYQEARKQGIELIFGFPNENSLPGFKKHLGWQFDGFMQQFEIVTNNLPLAELDGKLKLNLYKGHPRWAVIDNISILYKAKNHLYIGNVINPSNQPAKVFIKAVKEIARRTQCRKIIIGCSQTHWLFDYLSSEI
jgi:GNAT superfamily N-acetyltransferase